MRRLAVVALVLMSTSSAIAQDKQACVDAYTQAQVLRAQQKLRASKKFLNVCAADACPSVLRKDCVPWLGEVEKSLPSLTVDPRDDGGAAIEGARVTVDAEPMLPRQATKLDPGDHTILVTAPQFSDATDHVTLALGDDKTIRVSLTRAAVPLVVAPPRVVPIAPFVVAGLGVVGLGLFTAFGVAGNSIKSDLDAENCKPTCSATRVDAIKTDYVVADVALGVGLAFAVAATVMFIVAPWHAKVGPATLAVRF